MSAWFLKRAEDAPLLSTSLPLAFDIAVAEVVDVDVGVGGIDDVVVTDMAFHTGGEPDAVAVR